MENDDLGAQISRLLNYMDGPGHRKLQAAIGVLGALGTIAIWWARLHFNYFVIIHSRIIVLVLLAPPYLMAFGFGNSIARHDPEPPPDGLMSSYMQHEQSARKWRLRIAAGLVAALNLLLMIFVGSLSG